MLQQLALEPLGSGPNQTNTNPWLEQLQWGQLAVGSPLPEPAPVMARLELDGPL
jgi:methionyl-tRNA synthetase